MEKKKSGKESLPNTPVAPQGFNRRKVLKTILGTSAVLLTYPLTVSASGQPGSLTAGSNTFDTSYSSVGTPSSTPTTPGTPSTPSPSGSPSPSSPPTSSPTVPTPGAAPGSAPPSTPTSGPPSPAPSSSPTTPTPGAAPGSAPPSTPTSAPPSPAPSSSPTTPTPGAAPGSAPPSTPTSAPPSPAPSSSPTAAPPSTPTAPSPVSPPTAAPPSSPTAPSPSPSPSSPPTSTPTPGSAPTTPPPSTTPSPGTAPTTPPPAALPIELSNFSAKVEGKDVVLKWRTNSELNNRGFEIQRSGNGFLFTKIDWVHGKGTTFMPSSYEYKDTSTRSLYGIFYYRLVQKDYDGASSKSKVVKVKLNNEDTFRLKSISPNPVLNDQINVEIYCPDIIQADIRVVNLGGSQIIRKKGNLSQGINKINLNLSEAGAGLHYVVVLFSNGKRQSKHFVIVK